jgi:hypothetical protein
LFELYIIRFCRGFLFHPLSFNHYFSSHHDDPPNGFLCFLLFCFVKGINRAAIDISASDPYKIVGLVSYGPTAFGSQVTPDIHSATILPGKFGRLLQAGAGLGN